VDDAIRVYCGRGAAGCCADTVTRFSVVPVLKTFVLETLTADSSMGLDHRVGHLVSITAPASQRLDSVKGWLHQKSALAILQGVSQHQAAKSRV
jgi:hypothetical protein